MVGEADLGIAERLNLKTQLGDRESAQHPRRILAILRNSQPLQPLRVAFAHRIKLEFHGARITSDGDLLAYPELDEVLGLTDIAQLGHLEAAARSRAEAWQGRHTSARDRCP